MQSVLELTLSICSSLILPHFASRVHPRLVGHELYTLYIMYNMFRDTCHINYVYYRYKQLLGIFDVAVLAPSTLSTLLQVSIFNSA